MAGRTRNDRGFVKERTIRPQGDHDWRDAAACRDTDPDLFFPVGTTGLAIEQTEAAKAVCRACPVQAECLEYGIVHSFDQGIYGGATEDERRLLRRRRSRAAARARAAATPTRESTP